MIGRLRLVALTLLLLAFGNLACAQDYPTRTVRLVVAFPAGGPTDFVARVLADKLKGASGANVLHVPYRGAAPAVTDVVGGQVHAMFADLPVLMPQIKGGTLRPIGVGSRRRAAVNIKQGS
jgi:tripartite-type tricarboxylate transporter receptor subunit TctC